MGLRKYVACGGKKQGQIWFSKELKALRKVMHKKEKDWLEGKTNREQKNLRNEHLKARVAYSEVVKRAKRAHQRSRCEQLERDMECPKKFWRALKKMNVSKGTRTRSNLLQVYDEEGSVKSGEEALGIWQSFCKGPGWG